MKRTKKPKQTPKKKTKEKPLTYRQKRFVEYYIQCWNATEAARKAGYAGSDNVLGVTGHHLTKDPRVVRRINKRMDQVAMSSNEILQRLSAWGRGTVEPFITEDEFSEVLKADTDEARAAIGLIKKVKQHETVSQEGAVNRRFEIELHDAKDAVIQLAKIRGLYVERVDHTSSDGSMSPPKTLAELYDEERKSADS